MSFSERSAERSLLEMTVSVGGSQRWTSLRSWPRKSPNCPERMKGFNPCYHSNGMIFGHNYGVPLTTYYSNGMISAHAPER